MSDIEEYKQRKLERKRKAGSLANHLRLHLQDLNKFENDFDLRKLVSLIQEIHNDLIVD